MGSSKLIKHRAIKKMNKASYELAASESAFIVLLDASKSIQTQKCRETQNLER